MQREIQPMRTMERYEWLFSMETWIRTQKELRAQNLFGTFVRELGQVLQFDALAAMLNLTESSGISAPASRTWRRVCDLARAGPDSYRRSF